MMRKKTHGKKHNTRIAIFFVIFVCAIILVSIALKIISVLAQSKFDGVNRFTISVLSDKNLKVLSFSPNNHSISILKIEENEAQSGIPPKPTLLRQGYGGVPLAPSSSEQALRYSAKGNKDPKTVGQFLKIPIDGFIKAKSDLVKASFLEENKDIASLMSNIFFNYNNIKTNLTIVDILRLVLVSKTTPLNNIITYSISSSLEDQKVDKVVEKIFKDDEIEKENQTVEIVNTTEVLGLGGRLARLITNMGGNVIQVSTENNLQKNSLILYNGRKTYTVEKLNKVLGFKITVKSKQSIADIRVVLGDDSKNPVSF